MTLSIDQGVEGGAPVPTLLAALEGARTLVPAELRRVEALLSERSSAVHEGGHRVRPVLALLAARVVAGDASRAVHVAAAAELVHAASLVLDDWIDRAHLRRGHRALHLRIGADRAALASTELVADAFLRLAECRSSHAVIADLAVVVGEMASSEREEIEHRWRDLKVDEREALNRLKTARLIEWSVLAGARSAGAGADTEAALLRFARALGAAWQHLDDLLDLVANPADLGKDVFADIVRGRSTLPVILGARASERIRDDLEELWRDDLPPMGRGALRERVLGELEACGAFTATAARIDALATEAEAALTLVQGDAAEGLVAMAQAVRDAAWAAVR